MKDENAKKLINAINDNETATASSLISSGSMNLNSKPWPLHHAAQLGRVEIMTMLLDAGADINAVEEKYHCTACRVAILNDHFDALKLLVERGANLGVVDSDGNSLLANVVQYRRKELFVTLLIDAVGAPLDGLSNYQLMELVKSVAVFNRLLARGVNFTAMRGEDGATLCHYVARNVTREDDLRFLLNVCGNEDNRGRSALIDAAEKMKSSCVELLLAHGADVDVVANDGQAACHRAAHWRWPASLCAVVAAGGDLDQSDSKCETPRTIAARRHVALPTADEINAARRRIAKTRIDLVRERAFQICVGLQSFRLSALQLCEILMHSFGAIGSLIAFHQWWAIATKVKHFRDHNQQSSATTTTAITNNETKTQ
jgi:ankyrin repeat protein